MLIITDSDAARYPLLECGPSRHALILSQPQPYLHPVYAGPSPASSMVTAPCAVGPRRDHPHCRVASIANGAAVAAPDIVAVPAPGDAAAPAGPGVAAVLAGAAPARAVDARPAALVAAVLVHAAAAAACGDAAAPARCAVQT